MKKRKHEAELRKEQKLKLKQPSQAQVVAEQRRREQVVKQQRRRERPRRGGAGVL